MNYLDRPKVPPKRYNFECREQDPHEYWRHKALPPLPTRTVIPELRHLDFDPPIRRPSDASNRNSFCERLWAPQGCSRLGTVEAPGVSRVSASTRSILRRKAPIQDLRMQASRDYSLTSSPSFSLSADNNSTATSFDIWIDVAENDVIGTTTPKLRSSRPSRGLNSEPRRQRIQDSQPASMAWRVPVDRLANATPRFYVGHEVWSNSASSNNSKSELPMELEMNDPVGEPLTSSFSWSDDERDDGKMKRKDRGRAMRRFWGSFRS